MNVKFWYKESSERTKKITRPISKGLIVDGIRYTWNQVEIKWGISGTRFTKRRHANPNWTMEELLTKPFQVQRRKVMGRSAKSTGNNRRNQSERIGHLPEQLWANEVACSRWR